MGAEDTSFKGVTDLNEYRKARQNKIESEIDQQIGLMLEGNQSPEEIQNVCRTIIGKQNNFLSNYKNQLLIKLIAWKQKSKNDPDLIALIDQARDVLKTM
jgi:hypothetical protein